MSFSRKETKDYLAGLDKVIAAYAKKNGINIKRAGASFGVDITTKITITKDVETEDGVFPQTRESEDFKNYSSRHGIPVKALFEEIATDRGTLRILGYKTRSSKYPVVYTLNDANYKCSAAYMKQLLKSSHSQYGI